MYNIKLLAITKLIHTINIPTPNIQSKGISILPPPQVGITFGTLAVK